MQARLSAVEPVILDALESLVDPKILSADRSKLHVLLQSSKRWNSKRVQHVYAHRFNVMHLWEASHLYSHQQQSVVSLLYCVPFCFFSPPLLFQGSALFVFSCNTGGTWPLVWDGFFIFGPLQQSSCTMTCVFCPDTWQMFKCGKLHRSSKNLDVQSAANVSFVYLDHLSSWNWT